jgi:hypothetical protein
MAIKTQWNTLVEQTVATRSAIPLIVALLTGCAFAPLSFLEASPPVTMLPTDHYPVKVIAVDGSLQFHMPVQLAPGPHVVALEAFPSQSARRTIQRTYAIKIEPCTRYYLLAARTSPTAADWELVVHSTEKVSFCKPEEELKKTGSIGILASASN